MVQNSSVFLELVKGSEREYIIKDKIGITIGRVFIIQLEKEDKYCLFKINFYRYGEESYIKLKDTLKLMMISLFRNMDMYKINVIVDEDINLNALIDLGFKLEGILEESVQKDSLRKSKLVFGINKENFENNIRQIPLKLKGKNIELKILNPEDAKDILDYCIRNKTHLMSFEPTRDESYYTIQIQRQNLIESYKNYLNGNEVNFGIYKNNKFIGKIRLSNVVYGVFKSAFVGYSIDEKEQGKGYMKEALNLVLDYCFNEMNLHRIEASTLVNNKRSQGVLRRCGFKELGLNEKYLFINGKWRDHISFYKTAD
ncbi:GNAT family N-acetyltransferase [Haloimpatiens sp. FM7330]|uniref:GNAT family N-acetyltransferase n=1 Tax=Haloimpatiens sp. FM7330 TaxID=3298610 RepID=UPI00362666BE